MKRPLVRTLGNGLTTILVPQKGATSMTIFVMVRVGSRYETRPINGASHFIEHLMFKGTTRRPTTQILTQTIDRYGAEYNAFTGKDLTAYYIKIAAEQTPLAIDMLHDMLFHSLYDPKEIDRERGVIVEEINMYEDNPRMHLEDLLEGALFPDSTLGWNIAGPREVIRSVTREQLITYRDSYYHPSRITVVIAGKIPAGTSSLLHQTFGSVRPRRAGADDAFARFCPPADLGLPVALQTKNTEQVQLGLAFHGLHLSHDDAPAASLLATILGGSMSSRLFIEIRERRGLCYSIRASHESLEDTGVFSVTAGLEKKRFPEAVGAILGELKKAVRRPPAPEEIRRAKDHVRGKTMLAFEDSATQAEWYGRQWTFLGQVETPDEKMKRLEKVTARDVQRVAKKLFDPSHLAAAVIGPFPDAAPIRRMLRQT
ncbi:insulinase family protein [Candidatus Uhrbacteria bacterium]|nr:insulinase family protein [Candidatus Uhrbacteria bacterium]